MNRYAKVLFSVFVTLHLSACFGSSAPTSYYLLSAANVPRAATAEMQRTKNLGLGPVELAPYLDREAISVRGQASELIISNQYLWAEPLKDGISRVLFESLSVNLNDTNVFVFPWAESLTMDRRLRISIFAFDRKEDRVELRSQILLQSGIENKKVENINIVQNCEGDTPSATVACMNAAMNSFANSIIQILQS